MHARRLSRPSLPACAALAALLLGAAPARASTFSLSGPTSGTCSNVTFTVSRDDSSIPETVRCRTIGITAYPTKHFSPVNAQLVFAVGESSKTVVVEEMLPSDPSYRFQTGDTRAYRLQVTDTGGYPLCEIGKEIVYGPDYNVPVPGLFAERSIPVSSGAIRVSDGGFGQACHAVPLDAGFGDAAARAYLPVANAELRMTLELQAKEVIDGYQHVQILANRGTDEFDTIQGDEAGTPDKSLYMACFSHYQKGLDETFAGYTFPVAAVDDGGSASTPWSDEGNEVGDLRGQNFKSDCRASNGRLVLPSDLDTLHVRFDASGRDEDDWVASNVVAKIRATESIPPQISSLYITVSPGVYVKGNAFWVCIPFSEIVTVEGQPVISSSWGELRYAAGSGGNVLAFNGTIDSKGTDSLRLSKFSGGAIKDLCGSLLYESELWLSKDFGDSAVASAAPYSYSIAYDLAGGALPSGAPTSFTCESRSVDLKAPARPGYAFAGWTGSNGRTPQVSVAIPTGSHGDRLYVANWVRTPWAMLQLELDRGGTVTLAADYAPQAIDKGELTITNAVALDLAGHRLTGNGVDAVIRIAGGGDLGLSDGVAGGAITGGGAGVRIEDGSFTMSGGTISGNGEDSGVHLHDGTFMMVAGAISNNTAGDGGGVNVSGGTFTMAGGAISGNDAYRYGGGVNVSGGSFTMVGGAISGNSAHGDGGGVHVDHDVSFAMSGGTISGNSAPESGGVGVTGGLAINGEGFAYCEHGGTFTMSGGTISGNAAEEEGGGVTIHRDGYAPGAETTGVKGATFTMTGSAAVFGNTNDLGAASNVYLDRGKTFSAGSLAPGAKVGVTTADKPAVTYGPVTFANGAAAGDEAFFFSDDPAYHAAFANGELRLVAGTAYPAYLAGAEECVTNSWLSWARRHGAVTDDGYEAAFLLDVAPADLDSCTGALLRVSAFAPTAVGVRLELASDIPGYRFFQPEGDDVAVLGNGFVGLAAARDLAALAGETRPIPVPATVDAATGRAVLDLDFSLYLQALGAPPGFMPPLPSSLFARPVLTPIRPDITDFLILYAEP